MGPWRRNGEKYHGTRDKNIKKLFFNQKSIENHILSINKLKKSYAVSYTVFRAMHAIIKELSND
jgi:hypothetical protein